ncbi:MAG: glycogen/starch/alpha-glucan phosphorylase [Clostridia bacterium]|nr:glycogen/starch/alpha-glucan phosphorylase [Clostridia bacterium]
MELTKTDLLELLENECSKSFGCSLKEASKKQAYKTLCAVVRDILSKKRKSFKEEIYAKERKQVYYMSMEFLVGTSLRNNLFNLKLESKFASVLKGLGFDIQELYDMEPDAGLGNGGLGRLASCYMDSMTNMALPGTGFSIRYEFGIFRQKIVDGWQMEFPDDWLSMGDVWLRPREDEAFEVKFGGNVASYEENGRLCFRHENYNSVMAVPYDMFISGYGSRAVNKLVLWSAKSPSKNSIDLRYFVRGEHLKALEQNTMAEVISKVLYPADDHIEGKRLRLKQQYLLVSASLQSIISLHLKKYGNIQSLPDKVAIHINDTHPALCVPELMRILLDEYSLSWDEAWDITCRTLSYTNHTVMSEALERWNEGLFRELLPRVYQIVCEINRRLVEGLFAKYPGDVAKIDYMAAISGGEVKMANLCLAACHKINGVSKLHSEILKDSLFHDYYAITPERFTNVTNGIAYRRWLCQSNPALTKLLRELIGDGFMKDSMALEDLLRYSGDKAVIDALAAVKRVNKERLASYISGANGINVNPDSLFDVQIKRLHEYKRQLLNALQIIRMYLRIKENPNLDIPPRTFIFAAKASSGYFMAKQIIRLICSIAETVNADPVVREKIKVVFLEDYKVSLAEIIIPAAEISEQISIAGKEASGTGNMKLMINGAVTLGTLDGANVEIHEQVGDENMFLFGLHADEVEALWRRGYDPHSYVRRNAELNEVLRTLKTGVFGSNFDDIYNSLLSNAYGTADAYMALADFEDYARTQDRVSATYRDAYTFGNMSLVNIAKAGIFSSDRAVGEYAKNIWYMK